MVVKLKKAVCHGGLHNATITAKAQPEPIFIGMDGKKLQPELCLLSVRI